MTSILPFFADKNANDKCHWYTGDEADGTYLYVGKLDKASCANVCIKKKNSLDDSITGAVSVVSSTADMCWCRRGWTYRNSATTRTSCRLRGPSKCFQPQKQ